MKYPKLKKFLKHNLSFHSFAHSCYKYVRIYTCVGTYMHIYWLWQSGITMLVDKQERAKFYQTYIGS